MITSKTKLAVMAASALALALTGYAQMTPPALATTGYALGGYTKTTNTGTDSLNLTDAMIKFDVTSKPVEGVISIFYVPGSSQGEASGNSTGDIHLLDAYVNVDVGSGWTVTAGRYLSWMGYESFFPVNNPEITGAYLDEGFVIAGYEEGVRASYTDKDWNGGVSIEDSALSSANAPYSGSDTLAHHYGAEAYLSFTGIKDNTAWFGVSYDSTAKAAGLHSQETFDLWDQYQLTKEAYVAAELAYHDGHINTTNDALGNLLAVNELGDSLSWLVLVDYSFTDAVSAAFRVGGDENKNWGTYHTPDDVKYTFAPTYKISKNFSVRAEVSYVSHASFLGTNNIEIPTAGNSETSYGLQMVFQF